MKKIRILTIIFFIIHIFFLSAIIKAEEQKVLKQFSTGHGVKLYDNDNFSLERNGRFVIVTFKKPHRVISSEGVISGGVSDSYTHIVNHQSCEPKGCHKFESEYARMGPEARHRKMCELVSLSPDSTVVLGTAANMNYVAIEEEGFRDLSVVAVVTGGVEVNAGRAGDTASYYQGENDWENINTEKPGTINTILLINRELSPGAIVRAVMMAAEAKSAALQDLYIYSRYSDGMATGTGTDQIAIASVIGGKSLTNAGKHVKLGELIGRAVIRATKTTLKWQNGITPDNQCSTVNALYRLGGTREKLLKKILSHLNEEEATLLQQNFISVERDPLVVATAYEFSLAFDLMRLGILPEHSKKDLLVRQGAQLASVVSMKSDLYLDYKKQIVNTINITGKKDDFIRTVGFAFAIGFKDKWK